MPDRQTARVLALLTAAFFLCGTAFALGTPLFQNPDEPPHVDLVHHYAHAPFDVAGPDTRQRLGTREAVDAVGLPEKPKEEAFQRLPVDRPAYRPFDQYPHGTEPATTQCPVSCQNYQYGHPPGWYYLMAPVARVLDGRPFPLTVLWLRLLNVLLVAPMVPLTWWTALQVWPRSKRRPLAAAALMAGAGPIAAAAAAANNDALVLVLVTVAVALMARALHAGVQVPLAVLSGVVAGVGLLTKAQFLAVAPVGLLAVAVAPALAPRRKVLVGYLVPAFVGSLWWLDNLIRDGSLNRAGSEILVPARPGPWQDAGYLGYSLHRVPQLMGRLWGSYGWLAVDVPPVWRWLFTGGASALVLGWLACRRWARPTARGMRWLVLLLVPVTLVLAVFWASYDVYRTNGEVRGVQARYVYGAGSVVALGASAAAATVKRRVARAASTDQVLAGAMVGWFLVASGASFALAMRGLYTTRSLGVLLDRASIVAPVAQPGLWLALILLGWVAAVGFAAWELLAPTITQVSAG